MDYNKLMLPIMMMLRKAEPNDLFNNLIKSRIWYICDISILRHDIADVLDALSINGPKSIWPMENGVYTTAYGKHGFENCDVYVYKRMPIILWRRSSKDFGSCTEIMTFNTSHCRKLLHEFINKCVKAPKNI